MNRQHYKPETIKTETPFWEQAAGYILAVAIGLLFAFCFVIYLSA